MKSVSGKRLCKVLERHGWTLDRINGSHQIDCRHGNPTILSAPMHGNRNLKFGTLRKLLKLAGLTEDDL